MKLGFCQPLRFCLATLALFAFGRSAWAQARYLQRYTEPRWFTFHLSEISAGVYAEGSFDESSFPHSDISVTHEHWFAGPSMGFRANGSIYHPNLLAYNISSDGAFGYSTDTFESGGVRVSRTQWDYLGRFASDLQFLPGKPYHGSLFASYDHTYRDNDFFTRVTVDNLLYGARAAGTAGNWSFNVDYVHRDETSDSPYPFAQTLAVGGAILGTNTVLLDQTMRTIEDTVTLAARNERDHGGTTASYNLHHYERTDFGRLSDGTDHMISLGDGERFGDREQFRLNANTSFTRRDTSFENSDQLIAGATLSAEHRDNLRSYYDVNFNRFDSGDFLSDAYVGSASITHQFYESLISSAAVRASDVETSTEGMEGYSRRYGGGISEAYRKRIGLEHYVRITESLFLDHTDQQATGMVRNELHTFSIAGEAGAPPNSVFLNQPQVIESTIVVSDVANTYVFLRGFDYRVFQLGSRTVLERLPGTAMPPSVRVDYQTQPTPAGSYQTLTEGFQIRFDLWKNLVGIFGRINLSLNNAPRELRVLDYQSYTLGADVTWRRFRAGAEYEIYNSSESDYRTVRLFQSLALRTDEFSSLSFDFNESWVDYVQLQRREQDYRAITRYHRALTHHLGIDSEAGVAYRAGRGVDEVLAVFRPALRYSVGQMFVDAGYNLEYNLFLNQEERFRNLFFVRVRRVF